MMRRSAHGRLDGDRHGDRPGGHRLRRLLQRQRRAGPDQGRHADRPRPRRTSTTSTPSASTPPRVRAWTSEIVRTLTGWDETGSQPKLVGDLATDTGTPSKGDTVWTFHLRKGVK